MDFSDNSNHGNGNVSGDGNIIININQAHTEPPRRRGLSGTVICLVAFIALMLTIVLVPHLAPPVILALVEAFRKLVEHVL